MQKLVKTKKLNDNLGTSIIDISKFCVDNESSLAKSKIS